ncbi:multidrug ABC transporter ATP-binding protein [Aeromicrobium flavum]|uniref:Fatty acid ABC transporter ATP-binding/permease protein n=1 Tax=Aeromicrobium flavum TaxID=416568 RepID=A0A512HYX6_9ACTN|nr:ABC transporter ATP-binding protein [Aeromicrobium flavum]GEO90642.1 multidrug ABC transporter ATP-binding protein [Aeromicrobium flavum]
MPRPGPAVTHLSDAEIAANNSPVLRRITALLRPYRAKMAAVGVIVVLSALLTSIVPFLTQAVFDRALFGDGGPDLGLLGWLVAGMCALPILASMLNIAQNWLTSTIGNSAMADLRSELFSHLQKMELAFFTTTKTGAIQSRLANDVAGVRTVLTDTATSILQNTVTVTAAFISMVILSWELTILTVILMPLFIWLQLKVGRRRQQLARRTQENLSEMTAITEESLSVSGILLAKVFNRSKSEAERYRRANLEQTRLQVEQAMTGRLFFATVQTFFAITPAIIYLVSGFIIAGTLPGGAESLTAGTLVAFTTVQARLQMPLLQLMRVSLDVQTSLALFRRIFEYLDLEPAIVDRPDARTVTPADLTGTIEFRHVWFRYPEPRALTGDTSKDRFGDSSGPVDAASTAADDAWALTDLSFTIEGGQMAAIVGPSGSGKTTATYLVPRFYDVQRGQVLIDGIDVRDITLSSLADCVGMVTQEPYLFHGTIRENIAYAKPGASSDEIVAAATDANIHDRIMSFPDGYETVTGERGYRLSGGEKQRIAIARVLLKNPRILILDEATSALDNETERLVQEALERATTGRTTLAIAHRLSTIQNADVIFGLVDGRVVEQGTHAQLVDDPDGLYGRLYREQFSSRRAEPEATRAAGAVGFLRADVSL